MSALRVTQHGPILEIVLDRPKANAIDAATSFELNRLFVDFDNDRQLRVAIITGAGDDYFCTGADLKEFDAHQGAVSYGDKGFAGLTHFADMHKPVIAAVNGLCVGGGFELLLACDLVVASRTSRYALPEATIGTLPYLVSVQRLLRKLPRNLAMELLYTGRFATADELAAHGLFSAVVERQELLATAHRLARSIVASAPLSVAMCKQAAAIVETMATQALLDTQSPAVLDDYDAVMHSDDAREGARAFVEKRRPVWRGR